MVKILDVVNIDGMKLKIVGEGGHDGLEWFTARPVDMKGNMVFKKGSLRTILKSDMPRGK